MVRWTSGRGMVRGETPGVESVVAVDWSGAARGAAGRIWLAEVRDGEVVRLEGGRDRDETTAELIRLGERRRGLVVGLDFAFSMPAWFLEQRGLADGPTLWELAADEGEQWLTGCPAPFWGRPGHPKPPDQEGLRRTDRQAPSTGGVRPKSVFQIGGAGSVGTGSIRGMPHLRRLRRAGFHIWPFDPPGRPLVLEIYPRLFTGRVHKSRASARHRVLEEMVLEGSEDRVLGARSVDPAWVRMAAGSEDAFDALLSALGMWRHRRALEQLPAVDATDRSEGRIWIPPHPVASPD